MRIGIQQGLQIILGAVFILSLQKNLEAVAVPSAVASSAEYQSAAKQKENFPVLEKINSSLQKIEEEISSEQVRHQEKMEEIKRQLQELEWRPPKKWMPAKIAMVLEGVQGEEE